MVSPAPGTQLKTAMIDNLVFDPVSLNLAGRHEEAAEALDTCLAQQPAAPYCLRFQIANYVSMDRIDDAVWALEDYQMPGYETTVHALMETVYNTDVGIRQMFRSAFLEAGASESNL